ncbi:MAG: hypothetical protein ACREGF_07855, partial [Candidatus Saccharimonadales bacterium]
MKYILLIFFAAMCTSASAQWYRVDRIFSRKAQRTVTEALVAGAVAGVPVEKIAHPEIFPASFERSAYSTEAAEAIVMKTAQHNMRFRIYNDASYNFSELARLYISQNRYSEAIWYLLQSNKISREENDDKHTIENLIDLATTKALVGEIPLALQDLAEARNLANAKGLNNCLETIDLATQ